jgi:hypothetical protein
MAIEALKEDPSPAGASSWETTGDRNDHSLGARVRRHLQESEVSYRDHLTFAVKASGLLAYASVASFFHALLPALFPATAARIVIHLYKQRLEHHPNPKYQEMLQGHPGAAPGGQ